MRKLLQNPPIDISPKQIQTIQARTEQLCLFTQKYW